MPRCSWPEPERAPAVRAAWDRRRSSCKPARATAKSAKSQDDKQDGSPVRAGPSCARMLRGRSSARLAGQAGESDRRRARAPPILTGGSVLAVSARVEARAIQALAAYAATVPDGGCVQPRLGPGHANCCTGGRAAPGEHESAGQRDTRPKTTQPGAGHSSAQGVPWLASAELGTLSPTADSLHSDKGSSLSGDNFAMKTQSCASASSRDGAMAASQELAAAIQRQENAPAAPEGGLVVNLELPLAHVLHSTLTGQQRELEAMAHALRSKEWELQSLSERVGDTSGSRHELVQHLQVG
eukprot:scaffold582_cov385-Prasinococcus_capsulatus_cf.AAC.26